VLTSELVEKTPVAAVPGGVILSLSGLLLLKGLSYELDWAFDDING
jgi:hypothetical protein